MQLIVQKKGYRLLPFLVLALAMAALVFIADNASAVVVPTGPFEIDRFPTTAGEPDLCSASTNVAECPKKSYYSGNGEEDGGAGEADDWAQGASNNGVFLPSGSSPHTAGTCYGSNLDINPAISYTAKFICDRFTGIGEVDLNIISPAGDIPQDIWPVTSINNLTPKDDLSHGYFAQISQPCSSPAGAHNIVVVGMERGNNEGDNHWGIELDAVAPTGLTAVAQNSSTNFDLDFNRQVGDVYIAVDLKKGGEKPDIIVTQISGFEADGDATFTAASTVAACADFAANATSTNLVEQLAPPWNTPVCDPTITDNGPNKCRIAHGNGTGPVDQGASSCKTDTKPAQNQACTTVPERDFVEVAIDLTAYGISRGCFADVLLASVTSAAGTSSLPAIDLSGADIKDITAAELPPCGMAWEKRSDIDGSLQSAVFQVTPDPTLAGGNSCPTNGPIANCLEVTDCVVPPAADCSTFFDKDEDAGQYSLPDVKPGLYTITEVTAPSGFALDPDPTRTCTVSTGTPNCVVGTQGEIDDCAPDPVPGTDANGGPIGTDTGSDFCNPVGSLFWEKLGKDASTSTQGNELLPGFKFDVTGTNVSFTNIADCTTGTTCTAGAGLDQDPQAGQFCLDAIPLNVELTISETTKATGYKLTSTSPATDFPVIKKTLAASSTCAGTPTDAGDFINTPLSRFEVKFHCLAPSPSDATKCATRAQIACNVPAVDGSSSGTDTDPGEDGADDVTTPGSEVFDDLDEYFGNATSTLVPGTYTCTIVIDP